MYPLLLQPLVNTNKSTFMWKIFLMVLLWIHSLILVFPWAFFAGHCQRYTLGEFDLFLFVDQISEVSVLQKDVPYVPSGHKNWGKHQFHHLFIPHIWSTIDSKSNQYQKKWAIIYRRVLYVFDLVFEYPVPFKRNTEPARWQNKIKTTTINTEQTNYIFVSISKSGHLPKLQRHAQQLVSAFKNSWHCYTETKADNTELRKQQRKQHKS